MLGVSQIPVFFTKDTGCDGSRSGARMAIHWDHKPLTELAPRDHSIAQLFMVEVEHRSYRSDLASEGGAGCLGAVDPSKHQPAKHNDFEWLPRWKIAVGENLVGRKRVVEPKLDGNGWCTGQV